MEVLLALACYLVCLRIVRWAGLPVIPALVGAAVLSAITVPLIVGALQALADTLLTFSTAVMVLALIVLVGGAAVGGYYLGRTGWPDGEGPFSLLQ